MKQERFLATRLLQAVPLSLALSGLLLLPLSAAGCDQREGPAQDAIDEIDEAAEELGHSLLEPAEPSEL